MPKSVRWLSLFLVAGSLLLLSYLLQPIPARLSIRWIGFGAVCYAAIVAFTWLEVRFWAGPLWKRTGRGGKTGWIAAAAGLGLLCFGLLTPSPIQILEKFPGLAPLEQMQVRPLLSNERQNVTIQRVKTGQRQVPSENLRLDGVWRNEGLLFQTSDPDALLTVTARVPRWVNLVFLRTPAGGKVEVAWAGKSETIDLYSVTQEEAVYTFEYERSYLPPLARLIYSLTLPAWLGLAFAGAGPFFSSRPAANAVEYPR